MPVVLIVGVRGLRGKTLLCSIACSTGIGGVGMIIICGIVWCKARPRLEEVSAGRFVDATGVPLPFGKPAVVLYSIPYAVTAVQPADVIVPALVAELVVMALAVPVVRAGVELTPLPDAATLMDAAAAAYYDISIIRLNGGIELNKILLRISAAGLSKAQRSGIRSPAAVA